MGNQCSTCDGSQESRMPPRQDAPGHRQINHFADLGKNSSTILRRGLEEDSHFQNQSKEDFKSSVIYSNSSVIRQRRSYQEDRSSLSSQIRRANLNYVLEEGLGSNNQSQINLNNQVLIRLLGFNHAQIRWLKTGKNYVGEISNLIPHGHGRMEWRNGDVYEGAWKKGIIHGRGRYYWANGDIYEGSYVNGVRTGHGNYIRGETEYNGQWKDSVPHGIGQIFNARKGFAECEWKEGQPQTESAIIQGNPSILSSLSKTKSKMWTVQEKIDDE